MSTKYQAGDLSKLIASVNPGVTTVNDVFSKKKAKSPKSSLNQSSYIGEAGSPKKRGPSSGEKHKFEENTSSDENSSDDDNEIYGRERKVSLMAESSSDSNEKEDTGDDSESEDDLSYKQDSYLNEEFDNTGDSDNTSEEEVDEEMPDTDGVQVKGFCAPEGMVHESMKKKGEKRKPDTDSDNEDVSPVKKVKSDDTTKDKQTRPRKDRLAKATNDRTIFVGNLSVKTTKKQLAKMFSKFGEVESTRFRTVPVNDPKLPKKVIAIKKDFHPQRHNFNGYVCFKNAESAKKAITMNGTEVNGLHIRVDMVGKKTVADPKKSVFVGNLPLDIEEEAVREHFDDCGDIENVRIVRDKKTCLGKGFGFVTFEDSDGVSFALKLKESKLKGRKLRVESCNEIKKSQKQNSDKKGQQNNGRHFKAEPSSKSKPDISKKRDKKKKKKKRQTTPSNVAKNPFQGEKEENEKMKQKLKKQKAVRASMKDTSLKNDIEKILNEGQTKDKIKDDVLSKTPKHGRFGDNSFSGKSPGKLRKDNESNSKKFENKYFNQGQDTKRKSFENKGKHFGNKPGLNKSFGHSPQVPLFGGKKGKHIKFD